MTVTHVRICGEEPVVKGTRVTVRTILASLAEGASIQDILDDFPTLTERAVIASPPPPLQRMWLFPVSLIAREGG